MTPPIRRTKFIEEWIDMGPKIPVPRVDWIREKKLDVAYGEDPLQKMDIYYPNGVAKASYPVVILVHGGGFSMCDKRDWHVYPGFHALERGFVLASVNYRLAPAVSYPAESEDLKRAVAYLRKNAGGLRLQEENFFLYGTSAGGNLVTIVGMEGADSRGKETDFHVNAVAALCPLLSFTDWMSKAPWYIKMMPSMQKALRGYLGGNPWKNSQLAARAGADNYISPHPPAFYLQHGDKDPAVPVQQSLEFYEKLKASGYFSEEDLVLDILKDTPHAGAGPEFLEETNVLPILEFFGRRQLALNA